MGRRRYILVKKSVAGSFMQPAVYAVGGYAKDLISNKIKIKVFLLSRPKVVL